MSAIDRRSFVKQSLLGVSVIPVLGLSNTLFSQNLPDKKIPIHIFSKHLQFLDYEAVGAVAKELGFDGVDLTVRPNGHVLPKFVERDLPKAVNEIKSAGLECVMITTSIESVENSLDVNVLEMASSLGIEYYRTNWFKYKKEKPFEESLNYYQHEIKKLSALNEGLGIVGCYQNHSGLNVGASFWELHSILGMVNPNNFGVQYDIRHAMVEGGYSWENGFHLLKSKIKTIVLKDFKWVRTNGKWQVVNVPIGEGMVDFHKYFKMLKSCNLYPPASLHLEYDLGGAEKGNTEISIDSKIVFNAMKKDLNRIKTIWHEA